MARAARPTWFAVDTAFLENDKVARLADAGQWRAALVYLAGIGHSAEHLRDGFIPRRALPFIRGTNAIARTLVDARLWVEVEDGWIVPDFLEYQKSAQSWRETHAARSRGAAATNCRRYHSDECRCLELGPLHAIKRPRSSDTVERSE